MQGCWVPYDVSGVTILGLSTREPATAFWLMVFLGFAISRSDVRSSLGNVIKSALHLKILLPVLLLALYVGAVVWVLKGIGFWTRSLLKDTLVWFALVGVVLPFSFVTGRYDGNVLARLAKETVGVLIVIEFLISTFTFPLPVELVLLPAITFIALIDVVAESKPEYARVKKLTRTVLALFGFAVATLAIRRAMADYRTLETPDTLRQFLLPIVLSLSLAPYVYILLLYVAAEEIFIRVGLGKDVPNSVRWHAVIGIFRLVGLRPQRVKAFWRAHAVDLLAATSVAEIDSLLRSASKQKHVA
jgi:hypothetical protein